jgi:hypothetical protein
MANQFSVQIDGLPAMRAAFKKLPDVTRDAMAGAALETAQVIAGQAASSLVPGKGFQTGALKRALGATLNSRTGEARVGIRAGFNVAIPGRGGSALTKNGARLHVPTKIGHLIEFGHGGPHPAGAHPFAKPAVRAEEGAFLDRCRRAGRVIEEQMAMPGGRFL